MGNNKVTTQIIGGDYKGKKLELPDLEVTRSSKSIIRESFFNRLQFDIIDVPFVEFFGGSGSIGLEALSRGAKRVYFFEKDDRSYSTLQRNINSIDAAKCEAVKGDVFENFPQLLPRLKKADEEVYFYADPPFSIRDGMDNIYEKTVKMIESIPSELVALVAIEHMTGLELPEMIGDLHCVKSKKFGKTTLSYYER